MNYFIGKDPKKWRTDVPTFRRVKVENVYGGIDSVYYGNQSQLEYDFVVKPGVDPVGDPRRLLTAPTGSRRLLAGTSSCRPWRGDLRMKSPSSIRSGMAGTRWWRRRTSSGRARKVEFRIAEYDGRALVIGP